MARSRVFAYDLETETTYSYADNNEMWTMADGNGTIAQARRQYGLALIGTARHNPKRQVRPVESRMDDIDAGNSACLIATACTSGLAMTF